MAGKESQPGFVEQHSFRARNLFVTAGLILALFAQYGIATLLAITGGLGHFLGKSEQGRRQGR